MMQGASRVTHRGIVPSAVELESLLTTARAFVREVLVPLESQLLHGDWAKNEPVLSQLRGQARALGLWAPFLPVSLGGRDLPLDAYAQFSEVLGWTPFGHYVCNCQAPDVGNMELLLQFGTAAQQVQFLEPLARGEIRSCFAMTEPEHAGSNPVLMSTHAVRDGDELVISGHKWFTSSADGASFAVVMAVTDPDASHPHARASQILVPLPSPGYTLVRNIAVMGERGGGWASHAEVRFDAVRVPVTNGLGPQGHGFALAGAVGTGTYPPLHALDRHLRARLRPHVSSCGGTRVGTGRSIGQQATGAVLDRRLAH